MVLIMAGLASFGSWEAGPKNEIHSRALTHTKNEDVRRFSANPCISMFHLDRFEYHNAKKPETMEKCMDLLKKLKNHTRARIAFGVWDGADPTHIELLALSNWL